MVHNKPRTLAQMAPGSGEMFMAANLAYRLVQTAGAERVLFLVDRANLGRQTLREFQQFATPGDGRTFTGLYNVQWLTSNRIDPAARVVITTVQRRYSMLRGEADLPEDADEMSGAEIEPERPVEIVYKRQVSFVDACERAVDAGLERSAALRRSALKAAFEGRLVSHRHTSWLRSTGAVRDDRGGERR
jgi:type I restriction enzyme R subunit